mmetsp:Transcript_8614/g.14566  ORF Transcript_8614/g.14566 Transcript_8614/m.14566 type:complete len:225 (-) Transcript_8614:181-855(-)|eukprot:CAMPEP_0116549656 /NCGR_PEP_ID=MMETSP0397-20121206/4999_1 /TAXON_ID=216820 /ORGANISM="Cyclophora tenuis, Strain ECT3854" /LENGTH=224 /DNA_ID=CAMNT_0004074413 /DNA_START=24 /DNA_END=698 /DNA_ORIENTATION=-
MAACVGLVLLVLWTGNVNGFTPAAQLVRQRQQLWLLVRKMASTSVVSERDEKVQEVLALGRELGPIGAFADPDDQSRIVEMARGLAKFSDPCPSEAPYRGIHRLVYSDSTGGSSGRLFGPVYGSVTQTFLDDDSNATFINSVEIGPFQIALRAQRQVVDDQTNKVIFQETTAKAFGRTLLTKQITGGGIWNYIFHGTIQDMDGTSKLVRVMEAPSLFVLEQTVE